ncbi:MAG TPA: hypothetical protein VGI71_18270 [Scandinavium sp.]
MSSKSRFLQKLQSQQSGNTASENKGQADIAEFRRRMSELQKRADEWLAGTGGRTEHPSVSLVELLTGGRPFSMPGLVLHYDARCVKFIPIFLYGQGVTGCVDVTLCADGKSEPLCRLFMRTAEQADWTYTLAGMPTGRRRALNEDAFFEIIDSLLP